MKIVLFVLSILVLYGCDGFAPTPSEPSDSDISIFCDDMETIYKDSRVSNAYSTASAILERSNVSNVNEYSDALKSAVASANFAVAIGGLNRALGDSDSGAGFNKNCRRYAREQIAKVSAKLQQ